MHRGVHAGAIDAWAQPATGRFRALMPEVVRLFEKSGTVHPATGRGFCDLLDSCPSSEETVAEMDRAGPNILATTQGAKV